MRGTTRNRVWNVLQSQGEPLSAPVVALLLDVPTSEAEAELEQLYQSSKVEVQRGEEPLYRLVTHGPLSVHN